MRRALRVSAIVLAATAACRPPAIAPIPDSARSLAADIDTLTSPAFAGRQAGTAGADSAADFIARRYDHLGLRAAFHSTCDSTGRRCQTTFVGPFPTPAGVGHNIGALIVGSQPTGPREYVVIGAHFDGLGHSPTWSLDRHAGFVMRPGADDNASGTAAVLELARRLRERPTKRSILFYNFDAEEDGRVGSRAFVDQERPTSESMVFMLDLDMVGRLRDDRLFVEGNPLDPRTRAVFDSAAAAVGARLAFVPSDGRSDDASFAEAGVPAVDVSTGYHADYHTARDVPDRLDIGGLLRVVDFAEFVVRRLADR